MDSVGLQSDTVTLSCQPYDNIVSLEVPPDIVIIVPGHSGHTHGQSANVRENILPQPSSTWSSDRVAIKLRYSTQRCHDSFKHQATRVTRRDKINYYTLRLSEKFSS